MTKKQVLRAIKEVVLLLEKGRTTDVMARTKNNIICDPRGADAAKWCPIGAAKKVAAKQNDVYYKTLEIIRDFVVRNITFWNDDYGTSDTEVILAISFAAIAYREGI